MKQSTFEGARHDPAHSRRLNESRTLPPPDEPTAVARELMKEFRFSSLPTLRRWRGSWWLWQRTHWSEVQEPEMRSLAYAFTEHAVYLNDKQQQVPWKPSRYRIGNLLDALSAITILPASVDQPTWVDRPQSGVIVAVENGLLDIQSKQLLAHSPSFFNSSSVPFPFNPDAPDPGRWKRFLNELWPDEPEAIHNLGEWFGYLLSSRTDLHKTTMMVGKTRAGKGVIARILAALLGPKNVAAPTLNSLANEFGLAPLLGKSLAIVSDARLRGDSHVIVERLLSISGEDPLTVNRKYREAWTGKLPSRLHIVSNQLPTLDDASAAIIGRINLLMLTHSWLGREDYTLERELHAEMPGILNWALEGLHRLTVTNRNILTAVPSSELALLQLRELASPVSTFLRERCDVGPGKRAACHLLYQEYSNWARETGYKVLNAANFGSHLRAAASIEVERPRTERGLRERFYVGLSIKSN